jgi:predicted amidophosphoribosyltransferase
MNNCRSAFIMKKRAFDVRGMRLLIIDDVFTTGSTVNACARQLKAHGAQEISVLTVARGGYF